MGVLASCVVAKEAGISGFSGRSGQSCNQCHDDDESPAIELDLPEQTRLGQAVRWSVRLWAASPRHVAAGFNLAVDGGELVAGSSGAQTDEDELTHRSPQQSADSNRDGRLSAADLVRGLQVWSAAGAGACGRGDFDGDGRISSQDMQELTARMFSGVPIEWSGWWLPPAAGAYRFWVGAVAANCNGSRGGDAAATASHRVVVLP